MYFFYRILLQVQRGQGLSAGEPGRAPLQGNLEKNTSNNQIIFTIIFLHLFVKFLQLLNFFIGISIKMVFKKKNCFCMFSDCQAQRDAHCRVQGPGQRQWEARGDPPRAQRDCYQVHLYC